MKFLTIYLMVLLITISSVPVLQAQKTAALRSIKIKELVDQYKKAEGVMVINFWSTWCKPCIEEIPHFISTTSQLKEEGVQLLLVSLDTKALYESGKLQQYLRKKRWDTVPLVWLNETDADYYCPMVDSSWSGAIPATVIVHPAKKYFRFYGESLGADELEAEIKKAISG